MWFWIFMLVANLLIPGCMILFGRLFSRKPPKTINGVYGYLTSRSMKNEETWQFAHIYFGKLWYRCGVILLLVSAVIMLLVVGRSIEVVGTVGGFLSILQCVALVAPIIPTERELKRKFG